MKNLIKLSILGCAIIGISSCTNKQEHIHDLMYIKKVDADCIHEGCEEYYKCGVEECGKTFSDKEAKNEVDIATLKINPTGVHTGGEATCTEQAVCTVCDQKYGDVGGHKFIKEVVDNEYLAKEADCVKGATYYYSCECGEKGEETFVSGKALGHSLVNIDSNYLNSKCERCDYYHHIIEAENMRSNAWNEDGAEYRDKLWKTENDIYSGRFCVKSVNDNGVLRPGKVYLEYNVDLLEDTTLTMKMRLALGGTSVAKSGWKVVINGAPVSINGTFDSPNGNDWDTETWRDYTYKDIDFKAGKNVVRMYIESGCSCNIDYVSFDGLNLVNKHNLVLIGEENGHYYGCSDEGCEEKTPIVSHIFDKQVVSDEHLKEGNTYYYSCECGQNGTETFTADVHTHNYGQVNAGQNDVLKCDCGAMKRKFDLALSYSESWSEGTDKTDALWRNLGGNNTDLDSKNMVSHINDMTHEGGNDDKYWITIGVRTNSSTPVEVDLYFNAAVNDGSWDNVVLRLNEEIITPEDPTMDKMGWNTFVNQEFGKITLLPNQVNTIRISPKQGCQMNWAYFQIDSEVPTINATEELPL